MGHVEVVEGDGRAGDLLQHVVVEVDAADADQVPEGAPFHLRDQIVGQVHVQQGRDLPEREGLDLGEVIVAEVEMADAEQLREHGATKNNNDHDKTILNNVCVCVNFTGLWL